MPDVSSGMVVVNASTPSPGSNSLVIVNVSASPGETELKRLFNISENEVRKKEGAERVSRISPSCVKDVNLILPIAGVSGWKIETMKNVTK